ncbi:protein translocase SEC61 complex subunit gamma [Patescibacteria group bacterium]|nr:protein translocase SEC61 complex subunit gamma [Patescibacteria group bacterium]
MKIVKEKIKDLKSFVAKSKRVWLVLKKPSKKEFEMVAKISAIGIGVIGAGGFIISLIIQLFI